MLTRIVSTSDGMSGNGWRTEGSPSWWMRKGGDFVKIPKVEGRRRLEVVVDVEPGEYQIGTGKRGGRHCIRESIEVVACATGCGRGTERRVDRLQGDADEQRALGIVPHSFCRECDLAVVAGVAFGLAPNFVGSASLLKEIGPKYLDGYEGAQDATAGEWG